jgi:hypothetical protein
MAFLITGVPVEQIAVVEVQNTPNPCPDGICLMPGITRVEIPTENESGALLVPRQEI